EAPAAWLPPDDAQPQTLPYADGEMFHGPVFQVMESWALGSYGSTALLNAEHDAPVGYMNQVLLDGMTHAIPSANLHRWSAEIGEDQVGYPTKVLSMSLYGPVPTTGPVRCEVRFTGFHEGPRFPRFDIQLIAADRVWANLELVYILFPKGPLGSVSGLERQAFLGEKTAVPNVGLARIDGETTRLTPKEVKGSDWLPGTLSRLYETEGDVQEMTRQIAAKEHIGTRLGVHPSEVRLSDDATQATVPQAPLTRVDLALDVAPDGEVSVSDAGPPELDLTPVREYWRDRLQMGPWPGEDLYYGLAARYVQSVELEDPDATMFMHGRGAIYLANHQVGIESLLFSLIISALGGVPTATLAKVEHRDSWLGRLIAHHFSYPGVTDPELIMFFDRQDPASLPGILAAMQPRLALDEKSLLVHVDGTRSLSANQPVGQVTAALIDLALQAEAPIVPVRFVGGLPTKKLKQRLEFPYGHGKQTYHIGRPIWPEELEAMGLAERKRTIVEAINGLGPAEGQELPGAPDDAFAAEVAGWCAKVQVGEVPAVMFKTLEHVLNRTPESEALLGAIRKAKPKKPMQGLPEGPWFTTLADWLSGRQDLLEVPGAIGGMHV
ncbi:MAG: 1-acyl-sn-glycerol-3-phosphate acyltransferase, partial [Candidatus Sericytochromatia bacterium]|nr:1-acyl-sn-glycerol-3-phosphate acyltransferase [Candidatus Sericytochromatia bacterium]